MNGNFCFPHINFSLYFNVIIFYSCRALKYNNMYHKNTQREIYFQIKRILLTMKKNLLIFAPKDKSSHKYINSTFDSKILYSYFEMKTFQIYFFKLITFYYENRSFSNFNVFFSIPRICTCPSSLNSLN